MTWPAGLAITADRAYRERLRNIRPAGDWLPALHDLCASLERALGFDIALLDIGSVDVEIVDGRARLKSELMVLSVAPGGNRTVNPDMIWSRIMAHSGETFHQILVVVATFAYQRSGDVVSQTLSHIAD